MSNKNKKTKQSFGKKGVKDNGEIYSSVLILWNEKNKIWDIQNHKCKLYSSQKGLLGFLFTKLNKLFYLHEDCFEINKILYPIDETFNIYSSIKWASETLDSCLFFIQNEDDIQKGLSLFYRNLKFLEMSESLNGNKKLHIIKKSIMSHGLFHNISKK